MPATSSLSPRCWHVLRMGPFDSWKLRSPWFPQQISGNFFSTEPGSNISFETSPNPPYTTFPGKDFQPFLWSPVVLRADLITSTSLFLNSLFTLLKPLAFQCLSVPGSKKDTSKWSLEGMNFLLPPNHRLVITILHFLYQEALNKQGWRWMWKWASTSVIAFWVFPTWAWIMQASPCTLHLVYFIGTRAVSQTPDLQTRTVKSC